MSNNNLIVTVQDTSLVTATSNLNNPIYLETMDNIGDVDMLANGKQDGSILVYRTTTQKWTASTTLDAQNMEGGEF
jgi:hypothetical protein